VSSSCVAELFIRHFVLIFQSGPVIPAGRFPVFAFAMWPSNNSLMLPALVGVVQAALMTVVLLLLRRGWQTTNRVLAALFAVVFICSSGTILSQSQYAGVFPHLVQVHQPFNFLIGPLGYLYFRTILSNNFTLRKRDAVHGLLFVLCVIYFLPFYLLSAQEKIDLLNSTVPYFARTARVRTGLLISQQLLYLILSLNRLRLFSSDEGERKMSGAAKLLFVRILLGGYSVFMAAAILRYLFVFTTETRLLVPSLVAIWICVLMVVGLLRPEVFAPEKLEHQQSKYASSKLSIEDTQRHATQLIRLMAEEKPYLSPDLTLGGLAQRLSILPLHLSQVINQHLGQNFADFVNSYRIEEFKARSKTTDIRRYKIASVAEKCGFRSKSTFYAAFKKQTGETPSEFVRNGRD
jgi:AraC-like DNA-binding protein